MNTNKEECNQKPTTKAKLEKALMGAIVRGWPLVAILITFLVLVAKKVFTEHWHIVAGGLLLIVSTAAFMLVRRRTGNRK